MASKRDLYDVLSVSRTVSADELRSAYRKLARKYHPDVNKEAGASERFKEVQEAYDVLSDDAKRRIYDQYGHEGLEAAAHGAPPGGHSGPGPGRPGATYTWSNVGGSPGANFGADFDVGDVGSIFEEMFGASRRHTGSGHRAGQARARSRTARGGDVTRDLEVDFETAVKGGVKSIRVHRGGSTQNIDVTIPRGVKAGTKLRVRGGGEPSENGGTPGDLLLNIVIGAHEYFRLEGHDVVLDVPVSISEAALGARVLVPTLGAPAEVTIPPGIASGQRLRLRAMGVQSDDGHTGDLYVVVKIAAPKNLSPADQRLLKELGTRLPPARNEAWWPKG